ncbi:MAG: thrombospondin type 3 repeat-containing protein, partial [Candidatus Brocadiales bacterium]|nr:thrombospondin type 3 repeat-containing protein [Candidatus Brocadiales bacterium]
MPELRRFTLSLYISLLITVLCSIQAFAVDTEIIYDYDGSGQIRTVIYSNDLTINFGYDSSGNILLKTINSGPISNLPPSPVIYLEPEDQAIGQTLHPVLRWQAATDPESPENIIYNIYLSKSSPPSIYSRGQTETRLDVLRLEPETTYYWQINSIDPHNASSIGPIWSFTTGPDTDHDTVLDTQDNCPALYNKTQTDTDNDQYGDSCDEDDDNDSIADTTDNCPLHYNPLQTDTDLDGPGDACDSDDDEDYILDIDDNCPLLQNTNQADLDNDNIGDICDPDIDGDGYENATDVCPVLPDPDQHDSDANGYGDACTVTVCVSDSYGLRMALDNARSSSKDYVIKLQQGIYKVSESGRTRFSYNSIQPHRLNIQGGYSQSCTEQFSDPALSILDGEAQYEVLNLTDNSASPYPRNIRVENLTVTNGIRGLYVSSQKRDIELSNLIVSNNSNSGSGGGISLNSPEGISILKNSIIQGNSADFYAGIQATTKYGLLVFINNIVTDNTAAYNGGGISANLQTAGR